MILNSINFLPNWRLIMQKVIGWLTIVGMILGGSWSMFWLMEERHAQKSEVIELKKDIEFNIIIP